MRTKRILDMVVLLRQAAGVAASNSSVSFVDGDFSNQPPPANGTAVFSTESQPAVKVFRWTAVKPIGDIWLWVEMQGVGHASANASQTLDSMPTVKAGTETSIFMSAASTLVPGPNMTYSGNVSINDMNQLTQRGWSGQKMYFQLYWDDGSNQSSWSRYFTVTRAQPETQEFQTLASMDIFQSYGVGLNPVHPDGANAAQQPLSSSPAGGSVPPAASSGTSSSASGASPSSSLTAPSSGSQGLSTGAVAGIAAAAAVVGMVLVGFLLCFFLRRRRGRHFDGVSPAPFSQHDHMRTQELMADKDGGNTDVTPTSPYADDLSTNEATAAAIPLREHQPTAFHRHSHHHATGSNASNHAAASFVSQQAPAATSVADVPHSPAAPPTQYHHLVEEGMTAEEIRRLEEEERELDQAIENAGKR